MHCNSEMLDRCNDQNANRQSTFVHLSMCSRVIHVCLHRLCLSSSQSRVKCRQYKLCFVLDLNFFFFWSATSASKENTCSTWVEKSSELLDKIISYIAAEMCEWAGGRGCTLKKRTGNQIRIQKSWINRGGCAATLYTTLQPFEPNTLLADKTVETEPCCTW